MFSYFLYIDNNMWQQQCGKLNFWSTRSKTDFPYMFYTKFHWPGPIFCSSSSKCTHIGEWGSVSFLHCSKCKLYTAHFDTLRPRQHDRHLADDTFKRISLNENVIIAIKISLKFLPKGPINNIPALVQIMAWRRPGDKPLSEAMMVSLLTHWRAGEC